MIDSVFRTGKNYYPKMFLEKCKCIIKEKKMPEYITDIIETPSDEENANEENSNEENSYEKNFNEEYKKLSYNSNFEL